MINNFYELQNICGLPSILWSAINFEASLSWNCVLFKNVQTEINLNLPKQWPCLFSTNTVYWLLVRGEITSCLTFRKLSGIFWYSEQKRLFKKGIHYRCLQWSLWNLQTNTLEQNWNSCLQIPCVRLKIKVEF